MYEFAILPVFLCTIQRNGFVKASRNFNQSDLDEDISRYVTPPHTRTQIHRKSWKPHPLQEGNRLLFVILQLMICH